MGIRALPGGGVARGSIGDTAALWPAQHFVHESIVAVAVPPPAWPFHLDYPLSACWYPATEKLDVEIASLTDKRTRFLLETGISREDMELASHYWYADSAKATSDLGWMARCPNETLDDTVADIEAARRAAYARYSQR